MIIIITTTIIFNVIITFITIEVTKITDCC